MIHRQTIKAHIHNLSQSTKRSTRASSPEVLLALHPPCCRGVSPGPQLLLLLLLLLQALAACR
jgi:hypothetical protein